MLTPLTCQSLNPWGMGLCSSPVSLTPGLLAGVVLKGVSRQAGPGLGPKGLGGVGCP